MAPQTTMNAFQSQWDRLELMNRPQHQWSSTQRYQPFLLHRPALASNHPYHSFSEPEPAQHNRVKRSEKGEANEKGHRARHNAAAAGRKTEQDAKKAIKEAEARALRGRAGTWNRSFLKPTIDSKRWKIELARSPPPTTAVALRISMLPTLSPYPPMRLWIRHRPPKPNTPTPVPTLKTAGEVRMLVGHVKLRIFFCIFVFWGLEMSWFAGWAVAG
ncbi:hypothetical protein B0J14DRAFT_567215 [Halenospora varia]|nr:hypothetical protein B0J14DRAFT_567215 [Halenospora varia]